MLLVLLASREGMIAMDASQETLDILELRYTRDVRETQALARMIEAVDDHAYALTIAQSSEDATLHRRGIDERIASLHGAIDRLSASDVMDPWALRRLDGNVDAVLAHSAELVGIVKRSVSANVESDRIGRNLIAAHSLFEVMLGRELQAMQNQMMKKVAQLRMQDDQALAQLDTNRTRRGNDPAHRLLAAAMAFATPISDPAARMAAQSALNAAAVGLPQDGIQALEIADALLRLQAPAGRAQQRLGDIATVAVLAPKLLSASPPSDAHRMLAAARQKTEALAGTANRVGLKIGLRAEVNTALGMQLSALGARDLNDLRRYRALFDAARVNAEAALRALDARRQFPEMHAATTQLMALGGERGVFEARAAELQRRTARDLTVGRLQRAIEDVSVDAALLSTAASARATLAAADLSQRLNEGRERTLTLSGIAFLVCGLVALAIMRAVSQPLRTMTRLMHDIAMGGYDTPIPYQSRLDELGEMARTMEVFSDAMRDLARSRDELRRTARADPLTGLPNRRGLAAALQMLANSARAETAHAVMHVDLDRFKAVNDTLGHAAGDHVLLHCAQELNDVTRDGDIVARVGGDEFAVICRDPATRDLAAAIAGRLIERLSQPILFGDRHAQIGASVGIAMWRPMVEPDGERALADADIALYDAKAGGRGRLCFFEESMRDRIVSGAQLAREIEDGLRRDEFEPFLQPQIDLRTGAVVGYEALIRWRHPVRGLLLPSAFLDAANEAGLLHRLDERMLVLACASLRRLERAGLPASRVSVNICAPRLGDPNLVDSVKWTVDSMGLKPEQLGIEVLESVLLDERGGHAPDNIRQFAEAGFEIELDDFGTGHAAISNLRKFPVDRLKIDRDFVAGIDADAELRMITDAITRMGQSLGLKIMAEGVETQAELSVLHDLGCEAVQGYLIARPMPLTDLEAWLRSHGAKPLRPVLDALERAAAESPSAA